LKNAKGLKQGQSHYPSTF